MSDDSFNQSTGIFVAPGGTNDTPESGLEQGKKGDEGASQAWVAEGVAADNNGSDSQEINPIVAQAPVNDDSEGRSGSVRAFAVATQPSDIVWKGSPNFWPGRVGANPLAIVDHIMQGTLESATSWFANPAAEASSHFGVGKDGRIYQYVRTENSAWANGPVNKPDQSIGWLMNAISQGINPNRLTLSIEHEGMTGDPFPEEQYQSTLFLHKQLVSQFNIPVDRQHIIGHYQIDSVNRPKCPGSGFPWDRLLADLLNSHPHPIDNPTDDDEPDSTPGFVSIPFGPGSVSTNGAYVRAAPSFGPDGVVQRKLAAGTVLNFIGYTDQGPAFRESTRWYKISGRSGGGWIHALMIG